MALVGRYRRHGRPGRTKRSGAVSAAIRGRILPPAKSADQTAGEGTQDFDDQSVAFSTSTRQNCCSDSSLRVRWCWFSYQVEAAIAIFFAPFLHCVVQG